MVLISSDGDYAYLLSRLRDIGVKCVVIYGYNCASVLLQSADAALHWETDILGVGDGWNAPAVAAGGEAVVQGWGEATAAVPAGLALGGAAAAPGAEEEFKAESLLPQEDEEPPPLPRLAMSRGVSLTSDSAYRGRHKLLLSCVATVTGSSPISYRDLVWCLDSAVSQEWFKCKGYAPGVKVHPEHKIQYKSLKESAIAKGFLECALVPHQLIRLTDEGAAAEAEDQFTADDQFTFEEEPPLVAGEGAAETVDVVQGSAV